MINFKKKNSCLALLMAVLMITSLLPLNPVQAAETSPPESSAIETVTSATYAASNIATITSGTYTISAGGTATETITNVPYNASKAAFLTALTKGESNQIWDTTNVNDPVVTGDTLVVTAQDGTTKVTYTVSTLAGKTQVPPALNSDTTNNYGDQTIYITFTDDPAWRAGITGITVDNTPVNSGEYMVNPGVISFPVPANFPAGALSSSGDHIIAISSQGYDDASVTQRIIDTMSWGTETLSWYGIPNGYIYTLAGTGVAGSGGNGQAATVNQVNNPKGIAVDSAGNIYIADTGNHCIRKIGTNGMISAVVGSIGVAGSYSGSSYYSAKFSKLNSPSDVAVDSAGNLYIADSSNNRVHVVPAVNKTKFGIAMTAGRIYTIAGGSSSGYVDGARANSRLNNPCGVALDSAGNVYIADLGNNRVRKVDVSTGYVSTVAGNGSSSYDADNVAAASAAINPYDVAVDGAGNVYIADFGNNRVRKVDASTGNITTVAGIGISGSSGDGSAAASAQVTPYSIAFDSADNLYIADSTNSRLRKVHAKTGIISTVAGNGSAGNNASGPAASTPVSPYGITLDSADRIFICDSNNYVRFINGIVEDVALSNIAIFTSGTYAVSAGGTATESITNVPYNTSKATFLTALTKGESNQTWDTTNVNDPVVTGDTLVVTAQDGTTKVTYTVTVNAALSTVAIVTSDKYAVSAGGTATETITNVPYNTSKAAFLAALTKGESNQTWDTTNVNDPVVTGDTLVVTAQDGTTKVTYRIIVNAAQAARTRSWYDIPYGYISTVAGTGTAGYSGDGGPSTLAQIYYPIGITIDSADNIYFADFSYHVIRKIDTSGNISTVAGNGTAGYNGDGIAANTAQLYYPNDVAVDSAGNIYIADNSNYRIREVAAADHTQFGIEMKAGFIYTVGGTGTSGFQDGALGTSQIKSASGLALDSAGNIYFADQSNYRVRKINAGTGEMTTVAGTGASGYSGDGGPAASAELTPIDVVLDSANNIYIADLENNRVRKIDAGTGIITTAAGDGEWTKPGDDGGQAINASFRPISIAMDSANNLYIANVAYNTLRKIDAGTDKVVDGTDIISTVAGTGDFGTNTSGPAASTPVSPYGVALDSAGRIYMTDYKSSFIRFVNSPSSIPCMKSLVISGSPELAYSGTDVTYDLSNLTMTALDQFGTAVDLTGKTVTWSATGLASVSGSTLTINGSGAVSVTATVGGLPSNTLIVTATQAPPALNADTTNNFGDQAIYITFTDDPFWCAGITGITVDGTALTSGQYTVSSGIISFPAGVLAAAGDHTIVIRSTGYTDASLTQTISALQTPSTETFGWYDIPNGFISTLAGTGTYGYSGDEGPSTLAQVSSPKGIALDKDGNIYFADAGNNRIRKIDTSGKISTVAGTGVNGGIWDSNGIPANTANLHFPNDVAVDSAGNIYIADSNFYIREIAATDHTQFGISMKAGYAYRLGSGISGYKDGALRTAQISGADGIAVDSADNIYFADSGGRVRKIDASTGDVSTVAGNGSLTYNGDNIAATSAAVQAYDVALDSSGNMYIADRENRRIRKVDAGTGIITTVAGNGSYDSFDGDGSAATSANIWPESIALDSANNLYFNDNHSRLRKVDAKTGIISTVAGNGSVGSNASGPAVSTPVVPYGVALDSKDCIYISDRSGNYIRFVKSMPYMKSVAISGNPKLVYNGTDVTYDLTNLTVTALDQFGAAVDHTGKTVAWGATGPANVSGSTLTITGSGSVSVTATVDGVTSNAQVVTATLTTPILTPDSTANFIDQAIDVTFTDDSYWHAAITGITVDGTALTSGQYTVSTGNINFHAGVLATAGDHTIVISSLGYTDVSLTQTVLALRTPPALSADSSNNVVGQAMNLTFTDDAAWQGAINKVTVDGAALTAEQYTVTAGNITLASNAFTAINSYTITVSAIGYPDVTVVQKVNDPIAQAASFTGDHIVTEKEIDGNGLKMVIAPAQGYHFNTNATITAEIKNAIINSMVFDYAYGMVDQNIGAAAKEETAKTNLTKIKTIQSRFFAKTRLSETGFDADTIARIRAYDAALADDYKVLSIHNEQVITYNEIGDAIVTRVDVEYLNDCGRFLALGWAIQNELKANGTVTFDADGNLVISCSNSGYLRKFANVIRLVDGGQSIIFGDLPVSLTVPAELVTEGVPAKTANTFDILEIKAHVEVWEFFVDGSGTLAGYEPVPVSAKYNRTDFRAGYKPEYSLVQFIRRVPGDVLTEEDIRNGGTLGPNGTGKKLIKIVVDGRTGPTWWAYVKSDDKSFIYNAFRTNTTVDNYALASGAQTPQDDPQWLKIENELLTGGATSGGQYGFSTDNMYLFNSSGDWRRDEYDVHDMWYTYQIPKIADYDITEDQTVYVNQIFGMTGGSGQGGTQGSPFWGMDGRCSFTIKAVDAAPSTVATVTSATYTISAGGTAAETITNVPYNTSKEAFLAALTKGESHQTWDTTNVHDPVVTGDTLVVTAQDGTTKVTYTVTVNPVTDTAVPTWTNGSLTASNISQTGLTLTWHGAQDDTGVTGYKIYRDGTVIDTVAVNTYAVSGLLPDTAYFFKVEAIDLTGKESVNGPSVTATTHATPATVPAAPTNVSVVAGNGRATITFTAPTENGGSAITGYEVTASPGDVVQTGSASPITITGLANGTSYTFTVKAINGSGRSAASGVSNAVTPKSSSSPSNGSSGNSNTAPEPLAPATPESSDTGVNVLVNGKVENVGKAATSERNGQTVLTIAVDQKKLEDKLAAEGQHAVVTIPVTTKSDVVAGELNGQMLKNLEDKQAVLEIKTDRATYTLPAEQINIDSISNQMGKSVALQDIKVQIEIAAPTANSVKVVENAATKGSFTLVVSPIDFTVSATNGSTTVEVSKFNAYVERTVAIPDGVDPNKITTGIVVHPDGTVRHVPTRIVVIDGKYYAKINSMTNSTYTVVWHPLEFSDVANHWAKDAVNDMGSRMVINGTGNDLFNPDQDITRAEFAAIIVRGLGLKLENGTGTFSDVKPADWYNSAINTASAYHLINGFEDGTFRPNDKITREQAMMIIAKAMEITNLKGEHPVQSADETLRPYADAAEASAWAKNGIAESVLTGIVSGRSNTKLAPKDSITRAEVAAIVQRLLQKSELI